MSEIILKSVIKNDCIIEYEFFYSDELKKYFSDKTFFIEYPENIEAVPNAVAVIPFVCNVLPIIWMTDSKLFIQELDKEFYESISEFKKGYETMYSEAEFLGDLCVEKIVNCSHSKNENSALFYSGGLDSVQTLISHLDEKPVLLSIWGSDIKVDNKEGWANLHSAILEASQQFDLKEAVFRSSFREFDNEWELDKDFYDYLGDGWWHGAKHGIALLGHVAPYTYIHKITNMYIASSYCDKDGLRKCASSPLIDNYVRFCGCRVKHDGFEYSRQDKIHNLVEFYRKTKQKITLHVCWESQSGENCCNCEKCYRTIIGIWAENEDPNNFGFRFTEKDAVKIQDYIIYKLNDPVVRRMLCDLWVHIQSAAVKNLDVLKTKPYYKQLKWVVKADFKNPDNFKLPFEYRFRAKLSTFKFYKFLYRIKNKIC